MGDQGQWFYAEKRHQKYRPKERRQRLEATAINAGRLGKKTFDSTSSRVFLMDEVSSRGGKSPTGEGTHLNSYADCP